MCWAICGRTDTRHVQDGLLPPGQSLVLSENIANTNRPQGRAQVTIISTSQQRLRLLRTFYVTLRTSATCMRSSITLAALMCFSYFAGHIT